MKTFEFISYDGEFPNLCRCTMKFRYKGEERSLMWFLSSCGYIDDDYNAHEGAWQLSLNKEENELYSDDEKILFLHMINENIELGCCGGCI